jgi:hypothetical protein
MAQALWGSFRWTETLHVKYIRVTKEWTIPPSNRGVPFGGPERIALAGPAESGLGGEPKYPAGDRKPPKEYLMGSWPRLARTYGKRNNLPRRTA